MKNEIEVIKPDWYEELIHDLKCLAFDGIVKTKHSIGKRILEDELKFEKPEYGSKTIDTLSVELNVSSRDLYRCIQFARKYPEIPESVTRDKISWRSIVNDLLPEHKIDSFLLSYDVEIAQRIEVIEECFHKILPTLTEKDISKIVELKKVSLELAQNLSHLGMLSEARLGELLEG